MSEQAALMAIDADGQGHTARITKKMIERYEKEKEMTKGEAENNSEIRYIPHKPRQVEMALGLQPGSVFSDKDNADAASSGLFAVIDPKNANNPYSFNRACSTLSKEQCASSGFNRCTLQGYIRSSCIFNESYLSDDIIGSIEKKGLLKNIPVRAVLLDTAILLGRSDIRFACDALIVQFQRKLVSYGDMLAAIYIVYLCHKFNIQAIGCKQVSRYLWSMARAGGNKADRTARVDIKSRISYLRYMIGIHDDDTVSRFPEEGMNKTQVALTALMLGGAAVGAHQAWNYGIQQNTAARSFAEAQAQGRSRWIEPQQLQQQLQQQQQQPQQQQPQQQPQQPQTMGRVYWAHPPQPQPQTGWYDAPMSYFYEGPMPTQPQTYWYPPQTPARYDQVDRQADAILRNVPRFNSRAEADAYFNEHIYPQTQHDRTLILGRKMALAREVDERFAQRTRYL